MTPGIPHRAFELVALKAHHLGVAPPPGVACKGAVAVYRLPRIAMALDPIHIAPAPHRGRRVDLPLVDPLRGVVLVVDIAADLSHTLDLGLEPLHQDGAGRERSEEVVVPVVVVVVPVVV
jgi:hypothetical protein